MSQDTSFCQHVLDVIEYTAPGSESDEEIYKFLSRAKNWNPVILITIIRSFINEGKIP